MKQYATLFLITLVIIFGFSSEGHTALIQVKTFPWAGFQSGGNIGDILTPPQSRPETVDVDSDGDLDILVSSSAGTIHLYTQDSPNSFTESEIFGGIVESGSISIDVADWNKDGHFDIIVGLATGEFKLYLNNGQNIFAVDNVFSGFDVGADAYPEVVDWNQDTHLDVLVGNGSGTLSLFLNNGSDQFTETTNFGGINGQLHLVPQAIDWDSDGDMDIIGGSAFGRIDLFLNNGSDTFTETTAYGGIYEKSSARPHIVDWDKNGTLDLMLGNAYGEVSLYLNNGGGSFTQAQSYQGLKVYAASLPNVVDWDGDTHLDIVAGDLGTSDVSVFINDGTENFTRTNYLLGAPTIGISVFVIDMEKNEDGDLDFVVTDFQNNYTIYLDDGTGNYTAVTPSISGSFNGTSYPIAVDFDGDKDKDIIIGSINGGLDLLENTGGGNFTIHQNYFGIQLSGNTKPFLVDWNGDGHQDLVIGRFSGFFDVYLDDGSKTFSNVITNLDGVHTEGQATPYVIDWNKDGDLDIVSGSSSGRFYLFETDADGDGYVHDDDCDDNNAAINAFLPETCGDQLDNNCDGIVDVPSTWYKDNDGDGFGDPAQPLVSCTVPVGHVLNNTDCNDQDATIFPGANEVCDSVDNDCDTIIDENLALITSYQDQDQDGFGDLKTLQKSCSIPIGFILDATDCNDQSAKENPGVQEDCTDQVDTDCDGFDDSTDSDCSEFNSTNSEENPNPSSESNVCGDSNLNTGEECDDGNTINGDGCSSTCFNENEAASSTDSSASSTGTSSSGCSLNSSESKNMFSLWSCFYIFGVLIFLKSVRGKEVLK